ncbi:ATP-binding cassette domain-containing protein [Adlercreutzia murintestinalis]|uniref:ATP-binding cassette domain-containing protein n=1 Tax=Adlercreutzia murintestinalis TaxID=2941325 RepID=UPI00203EE558|nr:ATP-binding cassette domain-containing protein [Adlercreutzia murintestinalis]
MFKEFRALDNVSLEVKKGDVFGIMGTNGSGKSTLLKIIAGVLEPTEGTVQINGNIAPLIELGAGFDMDLTARENIFLNGALLGYSKKFIAQHFDEIVDFAEIRQFLDMPLKNYSSGMVARIAFAIATVIVPDILIVDEVLSVGDFMFQQKCERRIQSLIKEHDVTVLIVSHSNDQIRRLCNKAIWIEKGHTRMIGSAKEVCRVYGLIGGHTGSLEAEEKVLKLLEAPEPIHTERDAIRTFAGVDRYDTAAQLFNAAADSIKTNAIVIAPGEEIVSCMIGNSLAGALRSGLLLTKWEALPELTEKLIKNANPETIFLLGDDIRISQNVEDQIRQLSNARIERLDASSPHELAKAAYRAALDAGASWGDTAVVAHPRCTGDMISLMPYRYKHQCPLFFNETDGVIDEETLIFLSQGGFARVVIQGPDRRLPESAFIEAKSRGVETVRIYGNDPYDGSLAVNRWIEDAEETLPAELILVSDSDPSDALTAGVFAGSRNACIVIVDSANLDSMMGVLNMLSKNPGTIKDVIFLGNEMKFSKRDKMLIEKALRLTHERMQQ